MKNEEWRNREGSVAYISPEDHKHLYLLDKLGYWWCWCLLTQLPMCYCWQCCCQSCCCFCCYGCSLLYCKVLPICWRVWKLPAQRNFATIKQWKWWRRIRWTATRRNGDNDDDGDDDDDGDGFGVPKAD